MFHFKHGVTRSLSYLGDVPPFLFVRGKGLVDHAVCSG